jgi:DNA-binding response OmpR family regulator
MRVLVAEDNKVFRRSLEFFLERWGYECVAVGDGEKAWQLLQAEQTPILVILDWMMPGLSGPDVCQKVRTDKAVQRHYLILLTAKRDTQDVVAGLGSGADEFVSKPVDFLELRARLQAGQRIVELQCELATRVRELSEALAKVRQLYGMLPICAWCKKIRTDENYWQQVEEYLTAHADVNFTHGICPDCYQKVTEAYRSGRPSGPPGV